MILEQRNALVAFAFCALLLWSSGYSPMMRSAYAQCAERTGASMTVLFQQSVYGDRMAGGDTLRAVGRQGGFCVGEQTVPDGGNFTVSLAGQTTLPGGDTLRGLAPGEEYYFILEREGEQYAFDVEVSEGSLGFDQNVPYSLVSSILWEGGGEPDSAAVDALILLDAEGDVDLFPLTDGAVVDLSEIGPELNVRAETTPAQVGRVEFDLDGDRFRSESTPPYALAGDNDGDYHPWTPTPGEHELTATPYAQREGTEPGTPLTVTFTVEGSAEPDPDLPDDEDPDTTDLLPPLPEPEEPSQPYYTHRPAGGDPDPSNPNTLMVTVHPHGDTLTGDAAGNFQFDIQTSTLPGDTLRGAYLMLSGPVDSLAWHVDTRHAEPQQIGWMSRAVDRVDTTRYLAMGFEQPPGTGRRLVTVFGNVPATETDTVRIVHFEGVRHNYSIPETEYLRREFVLHRPVFADTNNDGVRDAEDFMRIYRMVAGGPYPGPAEGVPAADVIGPDGQIDLRDLLYLYDMTHEGRPSNH